MDIVDYTDASLRLIKGIQRLLRDWKLIILMLFRLTSYADSSDQLETVTKCLGENASFTWDYEVQPFIAIEWFFENTQIAETSEPSFSGDVLHINEKYNHRFVLQSPGNVGFNITHVTKNDEGDYRCVLTLKSTAIPKALKKKLRVEDCPGHNTSPRSTTTVGSTTPLTPTPPEDGITLAIVLGVLISCGVLALGVSAYIYRRYKRRGPGHSTEENEASMRPMTEEVKL
ncbi:uncharacterized protein LOC124117846 isoform X2 [Haliotis rufescens]|uniref:uncharacterized protein LOC124117846 isoform X2 n=1 Tax=Haliotis rufescens TaxID=6454 RepID=UPI00201EB3E1|nr:uncharacterized protein LOC124117846 isoform X2 [Haliotis rufescens]